MYNISHYKGDCKRFQIGALFGILSTDGIGISISFGFWRSSANFRGSVSMKKKKLVKFYKNKLREGVVRTYLTKTQRIIAVNRIKSICSQHLLHHSMVSPVRTKLRK